MRAAADARRGWATFAVEAALCLVLAYVVAGLAWTLVDPSSTGRDVMVKTDAAGRTTSMTFAYRVQGGDLDPFRLGSFTATEADVDDAPVSTLNLKVVGARVASVNQEGSAIIRTPDNAERVYRRGDEIVDGVVLERVEDRRVLVRRQGVVEALPFTQRELAVLSTAPATAPTNQALKMAVRTTVV